MTNQSIFALRVFCGVFLCGSLAALPACAETSRPVGPPAASAISKLPMKSAGPRKTNGSGIEVRFNLGGTPRVGEALPVTLGFVGVVPGADANVRFEVDAGLALSEQYRTPVAISESSAAAPMGLTVVPTAEGLAYLHVFTTQHGVTSVSSIPVQTGAPALAKPRSDLQTMPDGELVRTIPVK